MKAFAKRPSDISAKAIEDYGRLVLKVAYRIVPNADQAQEIFQETFLRFPRLLHPRRGDRLSQGLALPSGDQHRL